MKRYFSMNNFREAAFLGFLMTLLSVPRIVEGGLPHHYLLVTFFWLAIMAASVTAWGKCAAMKGYFPCRRDVLAGLGWALLLVLVLFPVKFYWFNPLLYKTVELTGNYKALGMIFPESLTSGIALTLWVMSFEMLFFQAASISFFARLTNSIYTALLLSAIFRALVALLKLQEIGVEMNECIIISHAVIINVISCLLFARYGLPASMLFVGGISVFRWGIFGGHIFQI